MSGSGGGVEAGEEEGSWAGLSDRATLLLLLLLLAASLLQLAARRLGAGRGRGAPAATTPALRGRALASPSPGLRPKAQPAVTVEAAAREGYPSRPSPPSGGGGVRQRYGLARQRYGLGLGEAEPLAEDEDASDYDELTAREVRALESSPEFSRFLRARGLRPADVERARARQRLYRRLRALDPAGFWALARADARPGVLSEEPSRLVLAADYCLSTCLNLAAAAAVAACWASASHGALARGLLAATALWFSLATWACGRPTTGGLWGLWYEDLQWGHGPPAWRCLAANLLEACYVVGSLGVGAAVSLAMRCGGGSRQSVGERCAGVRVVVERQLPVAEG